MRIVLVLTFCALTAASVVLTLFLVLLGMAPGLPPLDYTGLFMYGPGPGFLVLPLWLCGVVLARLAASLLRRFSDPQRGARVELMAWMSLGALLALQVVMLADFRGLI